ncbi:MAG: hypothetical protein JWN95_1407 [Frankiales bacterium]|nr:hypothetical protein [Frankiales bacterium]
MTGRWVTGSWMTGSWVTGSWVTGIWVTDAFDVAGNGAAGVLPAEHEGGGLSRSLLHLQEV